MLIVSDTSPISNLILCSEREFGTTIQHERNMSEENSP